MAIDTVKMEDKRIRQVSLSLKADTITADEIEAVFDNWEKGIKGGAYALHDCDVYTLKEVRSMNRQIDESIEAIKELSNIYSPDEIKEKIAEQEAKRADFKVGEPKPAHYHIILSFGNAPRSYGDVAKAFHTLPNMVQNLSGGMKGFASMLAYLTHNTKKAQEEGKFVYDDSIVKRLIFPEDKRFDNFYDYSDFIDAFINKEIEFDVTARGVLEGKYTVHDIIEKNPEYYLKHAPTIERARKAYVNNLPTPEFLFNYYIGAIGKLDEDGSEKEGSKGRIGKTIAAKTLAISLLAPHYPDVDFSKMSKDDLSRKGYIFFAGGKGVSLQSYDGQKVIIWDDYRAYDLIQTFGGASAFFRAWDTRPEAIESNIKFGGVFLKNSYNIVTGTQTYTEFINELSVEYVERPDGWGGTKTVKHTKEDKSQAKGRFPFFIEVTPSFVTVNAQMDYLIGSRKRNFNRIFENDLQALIANSRIGEHANKLTEGFLEAQSVVIQGLEKPELPKNPMRELTFEEMLERAKKEGIPLDKEVIKKIEEDKREQEWLEIKEKLKKDYNIEISDKEPVDAVYANDDFDPNKYPDEYWKNLNKDNMGWYEKDQDRRQRLREYKELLQKAIEKEHLEDLKQQHLHEEILKAQENSQIIEAEVVPEGNEDN